MPPTKSELWNYLTKLNNNELKCTISFKMLKSFGRGPANSFRWGPDTVRKF